MAHGFGSPTHAHADSLPIDPCTFARPPDAVAFTLGHPPDRVPRDGLLLTLVRGTWSTEPVGTTDASVLEVGEEVVPYEAQLVAADGVTVPGTLIPASKGFAFRPDTPLAPLASYSVAWRIDPRSRCYAAEPVTGQLPFVTEATLREPPPPALLGLAYGKVWAPLARDHCCAVEASHCDGGAPCAACWSERREPVLVPLLRPEGGEETRSTIEALVVTAVDGRALTTGADRWGHSLTPVRPAVESVLDWVDPPARICLRTVTEVVRTGATLPADACVDVDAAAAESGASLAGVALPPWARIGAPGGADPWQGELPCTSLRTPFIPGVEHALRFTTEPPADADFPYETRPTAPVALPMLDGGVDAGWPAPGASVARGSGGCSVVSPGAGGGVAFGASWAALAVLTLRRRLRARWASAGASRWRAPAP